MAKKTSLLELTQHAKAKATNPTQPTDTESTGKPAQLTIPLRDTDVDELTETAENERVTRASLATALLRYAMRQLKNKNIKLVRTGVRVTSIE